jgi:NADPH:quinone reductase-like Zn-dependent oxidoreductase
MDSAACGIINPLTAIAFIERYRASKCRFGMINTAAASSLGKMLIRLCKK